METVLGNIQARGPHSIMVSKVKGHSTDQQVADGTVRTEDKQGNDTADAAAEAGVDAHQPGHMGFMAWM